MTNNILKALGHVSAADWDKTIKKAGELMDSHHFGCSEAMVLAFQEPLRDYLPNAVVAAASSLRGGMGGAGCVCGALAGGQMLLGAVFGYRGTVEGGAERDKEATAKARTLFKELHDRFRDEHKATCCRVLTKGLKHDSPERQENCKKLVKSAAALAGGIIAREAAEIVNR
jgi:C_GCAxxG_C_C family probable redox protein